MHFTPRPFWFRIVSTHTVVLPVLRSPMISSRWPRPMGVMASMDLMPVCSGSCTGLRPMMPGAWISMRRIWCADDGALAVDRLAEGVDDPAEQGVADGHREDAAGGLDGGALLDAAADSASPSTTAPMESSSRFRARPTVPPSNSSSSFTPRRAGPRRGRCRRRPRGPARPGWPRATGVKPARFFRRAAAMSPVLMVSSAITSSFEAFRTTHGAGTSAGARSRR